MNFSRKTILVVGAALLAACGDKVTVTDYKPPTQPPKVNSVEVTPNSATLNVGQTITMTAAVNADAGLATTVTWSSSDATKASVSSAGVVTAVAATPGVAICATSTVDTGKKGCGQIVVTPAQAIIPATVSIASITAGGNLNAPVNPANVAGQIDVRLNVNPGNQTISKIVLVVGGVRQDSQTYTAAQAAALRYAADEALAAQSTFPQVVFTVNTNSFSTTTGAPRWVNGAQLVSAQLYTTQAGTSSAATATAQTSLTFNNVDGWYATVATSGTAANALNATGFRYDRGALTVSMLPVSYTGAVVASGTVTFGSACDASAIGARTIALVAPAAGAYAWTGAYPQTGATAADVGSYEFDAGLCALNAIGETPTVTAVNTAGDALFTAAAPLNLNAVVGIRLDNRGPKLPTLVQNPNGRANDWINGSVALTSVNSGATSNGVMVAPAAQTGCFVGTAIDCGVGTTVRMVRIATSAAGTIAEARAATPTNTPTLPSPSATNLTYCGVFTYQDALGNEAALPLSTTVCSPPVLASSSALAANHMLFGVDIAAPTIAYTAGAGLITANQRINTGTIANNFQVTVNDTGLVGNSGMLPAAPVKMLLSRRAAGAANSTGAITLLAADGATVVTAQSTTGVVAAAPLYTTAIAALTGAANHAYWTFDATAYDAAGNSAAVSSRTMVYDATAPVPGVPAAPLTITAPGFSTTALLNEDLDIQDYAFNSSYAGAPVLAPAVLGMPWVAVNGWNAATFANTNYSVTTANTLPLAIQANVAAGLTNLSGVTTTSRSQSNLAATSGAFAPVTVTPGTAISTTNMTTFGAVTLPAGVTGVVTGNATAAAAATPASTTFSITSTGTTAIYNNPFARIDFYMLDATGTRYMFVGSTATPTLNDNGAIRTFSWSISVSGATLYSTLNGAGATWASQIVALGMKADGSIGMVNAALTGINVVF